MSLRVESLRRYPVKGMGGEALDAVELDARGIVGDRWFAVVDEDGHFASGKNTRRFRRHDEVVEFAARTGAGEVEVTGEDGRWPVGAPALDAALSVRLGAPMRVLAERDIPHFDAGAMSLVGTATLAWCAAQWGIDADARRLRVNVVVATDEPFVEESWIGRGLHIGDAELEVVKRVERCRTIDLAQDGVATSTPWLKRLGVERGTCVAMYASVLRPGTIRVGDEVTLS